MCVLTEYVAGKFLKMKCEKIYYLYSCIQVYIDFIVVDSGLRLLCLSKTILKPDLLFISAPNYLSNLIKTKHTYARYCKFHGS